MRAYGSTTAGGPTGGHGPDLTTRPTGLDAAAAVERAHQRRRPAPDPTAAQVRAWARTNGHPCPARGPVPDRLVAAYRAAMDGAT